jgi:hypothetical protein
MCWIEVGKLSGETDTNIERFAETLAIGYKRAAWQWIVVGIPNASEIAYAILLLIPEAIEHGNIQSGGLRIVKEEDLLVLYADDRLVSKGRKGT